MRVKKDNTCKSQTSPESGKILNKVNVRYYCVLLALMLLFVIYTATKFPYTYITAEGDNFWVMTWDFWLQKLTMPPALTNWVTDYLFQFFASPYMAACIHALVLGSMGVLAYRVLLRLCHKRQFLVWLGILPPVFLGLYSTFSLSFQLQCLFFFCLVMAYLLISNVRGKLFWSILCVPFGFLLLKTPLLFLLLLCHAALAFKLYGAKQSLYWVLPLILLSVTPKIYSQQVAFIPFKYRYTHVGSYFDFITSRYTASGEYVKKLVYLSNEQRWGDLLYKEHIKSDAQRGNVTALRYALLAESALGTLPENLFEYPITDENYFFYPHERGYISLQFNRLFYLNLGIYDEAFHQAQEYGLQMTNGNCFSSLRQMIDYSIEEQEWEVADKYLQILAKSSCHKDFIEKRRTMMLAAMKNQGKNVPLRADNFVGGYPLPVEMLRLARYYQDSPNRKKMLDYAICAYILRGDKRSFQIAVKAFDIYRTDNLPRAYREFMNIKPE